MVDFEAVPYSRTLNRQFARTVSTVYVPRVRLSDVRSLCREVVFGVGPFRATARSGAFDVLPKRHTANFLHDSISTSVPNLCVCAATSLSCPLPYHFPDRTVPMRGNAPLANWLHYPGSTLFAARIMCSKYPHTTRARLRAVSMPNAVPTSVYSDAGKGGKTGLPRATLDHHCFFERSSAVKVKRVSSVRIQSPSRL